MKNKVNFNVYEKERLKKEEEESRRKQIVYEQQINEKRAQLRKDFEISKLNDHIQDPILNQDINESEFKKVLDGLISQNETKKNKLNKLVLQEKSFLINIQNTSQMNGNSQYDTIQRLQRNSQYRSGSENHSQKTTNSGFNTNKNQFQSKQENDSIQDLKVTNKQTGYSKNGFSQSYYRSQSMSYISPRETNDFGRLQERLEEINNLIIQSDQNILNENERYEQIKKMRKELTHTINGFKEKANHLKFLNGIANDRFKDIHHVESQANENKRVVNQNVELAKEQIKNIQKVYKQYREKKSTISQQLKQENEQDEHVLSSVQLKIEECKKQNELLEKEINKLDLEKHKQEKREKESYFVGLYLWSFEEIERIFFKGQTDNLISNYYEIEQNNNESASNVKKIPSHNQIDNSFQQQHSPTAVSTLFGTANSQIIIGSSQHNNQSNFSHSQNQIKHNTLDSRIISPTKLPKNGVNSSHITLTCSTPIRTSKKLKKQQLKLDDNIPENYLDDYEAEPPNFDRKEVLDKIHQYYYDHNQNIESIILKIIEFHKDQLMQCLLSKNQSEELIQQKKLNILEIQQLNDEIKTLKQNNFFLSSQTAITLRESNVQNSIKQRFPEVKINIDQIPFNKEATCERLEIVQNFLNENISMDSGFISKPTTRGQNKEKISTVNIETFCDQHKDTDNLEQLNEKSQKFLFQCYLSVIEVVERVCLIIPLIDFKIDQLQQKTNSFFEFEYVSNVLLKNCSDLFEIATNGKSLEKEFQRISELALGTQTFQTTGYSFNKGNLHLFNNQGQMQSSQNSFHNQQQQQNTSQNHHKQSILGLQTNASAQISQFTIPLNQQNSNTVTSINMNKQSSNKKGSQFFNQQLSYLNLEEIISNHSNLTPNKVDSDLLPTPNKPLSFSNKNQSKMSKSNLNSSLTQRQSSTDREREKDVDRICQLVQQDKMARYMLHEQFIKQYINKALDINPGITTQEILESIKNKALKILNDKINFIFKSFSNVYAQIVGQTYQTQRLLLDRKIEFRSDFFGSNHPPNSGGILSLPKNDFIIKTYMNAFEKQIKYKRNEDEDQLQKFARTSQNDKNNLIISSKYTSLNQATQELNKKNAIYKFIHEIADLRKSMTRKIATPLSSSAFFQSGLNNGGNQNILNNNNINNNIINAGTPINDMNSNQQNNINQSNQKEQNLNQNNIQTGNEIQTIQSTIPTQNTKDNLNINELTIYEKKSIQNSEEDFIEEERKNLKLVEIKEYEDLMYRDAREKERQQQEEKKKRIVYHRLLSNAETDYSKQEKETKKQFTTDSDILFKINRLENTSQIDQFEKINETIKQENNKINSKFAKEFSKLELTYLKSNTIYNLRRDINLRERREFKKQDINNKYYIPQFNNNEDSKLEQQKEAKLPKPNNNSNKSNHSTNALMKKRNFSYTNTLNDGSQTNKLDDISIKIHQSYSVNNTSRNKSKSFKIINSQLQKKLIKEYKQPENQNKYGTGYFTPKLSSRNKYSSPSTEDMSQFQSINNLQFIANNNQFEGNFSNNLSLLVSQNIPISATTMNTNLPIHYKYLNSDWVQQLTPNNQIAINSLSSLYLQKNSSVIRKAFTSQQVSRTKSFKINNNNQ